MTTVDSSRRLLRLSEVAAMLGISLDRARELVASGEIRSVRLGGSGWHRVPIAEVERLLQPEEG